MRTVALVAVIAITSGITSAQPQNLVPNGGFEDYRRCPGDFSESAEEFAVLGWRSASRGTPDHFHSCSSGDANVPYNWAGVADAWEGDGYAGIYVWMSDDNQYREYLQCKLAQPLVKDSTYEIGFRFKLSSYSKYAVDRILDFYARQPTDFAAYFQAAWRYKHRSLLGQANATLAGISGAL